MRYVVTGCAGFIGSHLCDALLDAGHTVVGIDLFTDYYSRDLKERNLMGSLRHERFTLQQGDLNTLDLHSLLEGADGVFHLAAQAGVRASWGTSFDAYTQHNVLATQRLLEACRDHSTLRRVVYASSSSIYGNAVTLPLDESSTPKPVSPYGVTKLAAEHLCTLYHSNFGVPTVALRYFTVYGARQRPDMAFNVFIRSALTGKTLHVNEDGNQTRDFTHVGDIVRANILASQRDIGPGKVYNIAGGSRVTVRHVLERIAQITGRDLDIRYRPRQAGDVRHTFADISRAQRDLGYAPKTSLDEGLLDELGWLEQTQRRNRRAAEAAA